MNVAIFSAKKYDREFLNAANGSLHKLRFFGPQLNEETVGLATGFEAVCVFVNDHVDAAVIAAEPSGVSLTITRQVLGFALQKLRGSLRLIPSTDAGFSKGFL